MPTAAALTRGELLARNGCLTIVRQPLAPAKPAPGQPGSGSSYVQDSPEIFVAILDDGRILAFNGHVDLGTGIRTSLAFAFVLLVATELIAARSGLGYMIGWLGDGGVYDAMFAVVLTVSLLGFAADRGYLMLMRRVLRWRE